jgi:curved DNA-binding protein CbpA
MLPRDAANILGLSGHITPEAVKAAYRAAAKKYHPDINPAGEHMMKAANAAFEALKDFTGTPEEHARSFTTETYPDELEAAILAIIDLPGLEIEICGMWVWVSGETRSHKEALKAAGFRWARKKQMWNFRPAGWKSCNRGRTWDMDKIRDAHGSTRVHPRRRERLEEAA